MNDVSTAPAPFTGIHRVAVEGRSTKPRRPDTPGGPARSMIGPLLADRWPAPAANAAALPCIQLVSTVASSWKHASNSPDSPRTRL